MIRLKESISVKGNIASVFKYVSDFSHIFEWDPGVVASKKTRAGRIKQGTSFELVLKFGPFRPMMRYTITSYKPYTKVVLEGRSESFKVTDTILFRENGHNTRIDYYVEIRFSRFMKFIEPLLMPALTRTGKNGINGLQKVLDGYDPVVDQSGLFQSGTSLVDWLADHLVLPGMLMFSKIGYDLGRRFWNDRDETLYGKRVVLTGGTSGIGKAAAFELARKKAFLTIVARNEKKAQKVVAQIVRDTDNPNVGYLVADLSLMTDIEKVAEKISNEIKSVDVLINNAGALFNERRETGEGFEMTFATDLLGVFLLTQLLKDNMARGGRIINVSSGGMYTQKIDIEDLENEHGQYNGAKAYARAKRGVVILSRMWAKQLRKNNVTVHSMHPGWVDTPGIEKALPGFHALVNKILRTPEQGADTIVWLAVSKAAGQRTGLFWLDRRPHETVIFPGTGQTAAERHLLTKKLEQKIAGHLR